MTGKLWTCAIRIYVYTKESHCPLPDELKPFCEEGQEAQCPHYIPRKPFKQKAFET